MWKKLTVILMVMILMVLFAMPLFATSGRYGNQISQPRESTGIFKDTQGVDMDEGVWVYATKIFADDSSSFMGVYNADTEGECTAANLKDEIGEATQYDTKFQPFSTPVYFSDGAYAIITTGVGWIEYGAQP